MMLPNLWILLSMLELYEFSTMASLLFESLLVLTYHVIVYCSILWITQQCLRSI